MADEMPKVQSAVPQQDEPQTFSLDYVRELRRENKSLREQRRDSDEKRGIAEALAKEATENAVRTVEEANKAASQRIARSELKAVAIKAGIVDLDGLKLIEQDALTLNDKGELEGADALIEKLKDEKPYLFGSAASTSTHAAPDPKPPTPKNAMDMSQEEWQAAKQQISKR